MCKPIYRNSYESAVRFSEVELWRESYKENCKCARAIEDAIKEGFDGTNLRGDCHQEVIRQYGHNRVNYVLANTIREKSHDGRFSEANKQWAGRNYVPRDELHNWAFTVESHPAVLNGFADQVKKAWNELGLFEGTHCIVDSRSQDYTGKVLIIDPKWLSEKYLKPEFQLFRADSGFGCSPTASGRKVFGQFLFDGEDLNLNRSDFLGIIQDEHLPQWAKEKLDMGNTPAESSPTEQTM